MSSITFRPFVRMSDYDLIKKFWMKVDMYNSNNNPEKFKEELDEIIKEMKYRGLKLSKIQLVYQILY